MSNDIYRFNNLFSQAKMEKLRNKNGLKFQELVDREGDDWKIVYNSDLISKNVLLAYYDLEKEISSEEEGGAELGMSPKEKHSFFVQCYVVALTIQNGVSYAYLLLNLPMPTAPLLTFQVLRDTAVLLKDSSSDSVTSDLEDIGFDVERSDKPGHKEESGLSYEETKWIFDTFTDLTGERFFVYQK